MLLLGLWFLLTVKNMAGQCLRPGSKKKSYPLQLHYSIACIVISGAESTSSGPVFLAGFKIKPGLVRRAYNWWEVYRVTGCPILMRKRKSPLMPEIVIASTHDGAMCLSPLYNCLPKYLTCCWQNCSLSLLTLWPSIAKAVNKATESFNMTSRSSAYWIGVLVMSRCWRSWANTLLNMDGLCIKPCGNPVSVYCSPW